MHHTLERIINKISDYKVCKFCGRVNWYENKECLMCGEKKFRKMTEQDAYTLQQIYLDNETDIDV